MRKSNDWVVLHISLRSHEKRAFLRKRKRFGLTSRAFLQELGAFDVETAKNYDEFTLNLLKVKPVSSATGYRETNEL